MERFKLIPMSPLAIQLSSSIPGCSGGIFLSDDFPFGRNANRELGLILPQHLIQFSNNHCRIYCKRAQGIQTWFLEDTSTNGTFVNDQRVLKFTTVPLAEGDRIRLSTFPGEILEYEFVREASPAQADNDGMRSAAGGLPIGEAYAHAQGLAHAYAQRSGDEVEHGEAMSRERTMSPVMQAHNLAPHQQQLGAKRKLQVSSYEREQVDETGDVHGPPPLKRMSSTAHGDAAAGWAVHTTTLFAPPHRAGHIQQPGMQQQQGRYNGQVGIGSDSHHHQQQQQQTSSAICAPPLPNAQQQQQQQQQHSPGGGGMSTGGLHYPAHHQQQAHAQQQQQQSGMAGAGGSGIQANELVQQLGQLEKTNQELRRRLDAARRGKEDAEQRAAAVEGRAEDAQRREEVKRMEAEAKARERERAAVDALTTQLHAQALRAGDAERRAAAAEARAGEEAAGKAAADKLLADAKAAADAAAVEAATAVSEAVALRAEVAGLRAAADERDRLAAALTAMQAARAAEEGAAARHAAQAEADRAALAAAQRLASQRDAHAAEAEARAHAEHQARRGLEDDLASARVSLEGARRRVDAAEERAQGRQDRALVQRTQLRSLDAYLRHVGSQAEHLQGMLQVAQAQLKETLTDTDTDLAAAAGAAATTTHHGTAHHGSSNGGGRAGMLTPGGLLPLLEQAAAANGTANANVSAGAGVAVHVQQAPAPGAGLQHQMIVEEGGMMAPQHGVNFQAAGLASQYAAVKNSAAAANAAAAGTPGPTQAPSFHQQLQFPLSHITPVSTPHAIMGGAMLQTAPNTAAAVGAREALTSAAELQSTGGLLQAPQHAQAQMQAQPVPTQAEQQARWLGGSGSAPDIIGSISMRAMLAGANLGLSGPMGHPSQGIMQLPNSAPFISQLPAVGSIGLGSTFQASEAGSLGQQVLLANAGFGSIHAYGLNASVGIEDQVHGDSGTASGMRTAPASPQHAALATAGDAVIADGMDGVEGDGVSAEGLDRVLVTHPSEADREHIALGGSGAHCDVQMHGEHPANASAAAHTARKNEAGARFAADVAGHMFAATQCADDWAQLFHAAQAAGHGFKPIDSTSALFSRDGNAALLTTVLAPSHEGIASRAAAAAAAAAVATGDSPTAAAARARAKEAEGAGPIEQCHTIEGMEHAPSASEGGGSEASPTQAMPASGNRRSRGGITAQRPGSISTGCPMEGMSTTAAQAAAARAAPRATGAGIASASKGPPMPQSDGCKPPRSASAGRSPSMAAAAGASPQSGMTAVNMASGMMASPGSAARSLSRVQQQDKDRAAVPIITSLVYSPNAVQAGAAGVHRGLNGADGIDGIDGDTHMASGEKRGGGNCVGLFGNASPSGKTTPVGMASDGADMCMDLSARFSVVSGRQQAAAISPAPVAAAAAAAGTEAGMSEAVARLAGQQELLGAGDSNGPSASLAAAAAGVAAGTAAGASAGVAAGAGAGAVRDAGFGPVAAVMHADEMELEAFGGVAAPPATHADAAAGACNAPPNAAIDLHASTADGHSAQDKEQQQQDEAMVCANVSEHVPVPVSASLLGGSQTPLQLGSLPLPAVNGNAALADALLAGTASAPISADASGGKSATNGNETAAVHHAADGGGKGMQLQGDEDNTEALLMDGMEDEGALASVVGSPTVTSQDVTLASGLTPVGFSAAGGVLRLDSTIIAEQHHDKEAGMQASAAAEGAQASPLNCHVSRKKSQRHSQGLSGTGVASNAAGTPGGGGDGGASRAMAPGQSAAIPSSVAGANATPGAGMIASMNTQDEESDMAGSGALGLLELWARAGQVPNQQRGSTANQTPERAQGHSDMAGQHTDALLEIGNVYGSIGASGMNCTPGSTSMDPHASSVEGEAAAGLVRVAGAMAGTEGSAGGLSSSQCGAGHGFGSQRVDGGGGSQCGMPGMHLSHTPAHTATTPLHHLPPQPPSQGPRGGRMRPQ